MEKINKNEPNNSSYGMHNILIKVKKMLFYVKQSLGNENEESSIAPLQIIFPSGESGLALPMLKTSNANTNTVRQLAGRVAILSRPENSNNYEHNITNLKLTFHALSLANIIVTCILFSRADFIDTSKLSTIRTHILPQHFDAINSCRTPQENTVFAISILLNIFGSIFVHINWNIGINFYAVASVLMLVLTMPISPYFMYSFRYVLDILMVFTAYEMKKYTDINFLSLINSTPFNS